MGYYINPPDMTKEAFLECHGTRISSNEALTHNYGSSTLPVCLVHNGGFTAAAIAYCVEETREFADPMDHRPKRWYLVDKTLLEPYFED